MKGAPQLGAARGQAVPWPSGIQRVCTSLAARRKASSPRRRVTPTTARPRGVLTAGKVLPGMDSGADNQVDPQVLSGLHGHSCLPGEMSAPGRGKHRTPSSLFISACLGAGSLSSSSPTASDSENV